MMKTTQHSSKNQRVVVPLLYRSY